MRQKRKMTQTDLTIINDLLETKLENQKLKIELEERDKEIKYLKTLLEKTTN